ncbi:hypothetical protein EOD39_18288 [Acipenser ruthenus]|uniref:Uncharacterized protein n=1 Tax=Acipenser ruthenus TaxID=7906 RepID=A0A444V1D5_ACIRT|nr:hypothetical protein EOD39_18288 [Acipenser ruthenus]
MDTFNRTVEVIERNDISVTEVVLHIRSLKDILTARLCETFVTTDEKAQLDVLVEAGDISAEEFYGAVKNFYSIALDYLDHWAASFEGTEKLG